MEIKFLGATGTVTGSRYLISHGSKKILIDCGLFQGYKQLRLRNWAPFPVDPADIAAVVLTHAHIDHSGYLPLLVKNGFGGRIHCTSASAELCKILLPDSGRLHEEEARYANKRGYSKHKPALPLYTEADAEHALHRLAPAAYEREIQVTEGMSVQFIPNGHILGSAFVLLKCVGLRVLFSGDIGRPHDLLMVAPKPIAHADYVVLESTYGNRKHPAADPLEDLTGVVNQTVERGGVVIIPAFAVGRAQALLYYLYLLKSRRAIPDIPVFLNSPMAASVNHILHRHRAEHRLSVEECDALAHVAHVVTDAEESIALNRRKGPMIIVAASGMATGGRVLHHLKAFAPDPRNTILFTGFQAGGTRGAAMVNGAESIKIHGEYLPVRAHVQVLDSLSAHADYTEILDWLQGFSTPPRQLFITHGEPAAADALRHHIKERFGWRCYMPDYLESVQLETEEPTFSAM